MHEGGCECGQVRYRMDDPVFVNCCHCRMCQRRSGSAFAVNAMIEAGLVEVISGQTETVAGAGYRAERCAECLTELWTYHRLFGDAFRFVYVGTLDAGEALRPDAHFFTASKHPWITLPGDVPAFAGLPESDEELWPAETSARVQAALAASAPER